MTSPDRPAADDDIFASILAGLSGDEPGTRPPEPLLGSDGRGDGAPGDGPSDGPGDGGALDAALFDEPAEGAPVAPPDDHAPLDVAALTAAEDAGRWGPDAAAPTPVDGDAVAELFPEAPGEPASPYITSIVEPHVPWWEKPRVRTGLAAAGVLVLLAGGITVAALSGDEPADSEISTDTTARGEPEDERRNEDAAVTTSTAAPGPDPTGLPADVMGTEASNSSTTPTTKKPAPKPTPPASTAPPPTTAPPEAPPPTEAVEADVAWGRDMAASTAWAHWPGKLYLGDDAGAAQDVFLSMSFNEPARRLSFTITVGSPQPNDPRNPYDLGFEISVVPQVENITRFTAFGSMAVRLADDRSLVGTGTRTPDASEVQVAVTSAGPLSNAFIRLEFAPEGGAKAVYEFRVD